MNPQRVSEATRQYQNALEAHRKQPDCEGLWQELQDARHAMTEAWIHQQTQASWDHLTGGLAA